MPSVMQVSGHSALTSRTLSVTRAIWGWMTGAPDYSALQHAAGARSEATRFGAQAVSACFMCRYTRPRDTPSLRAARETLPSQAFKV